MNHMPFPRRTGVGVGVRWLYLLGAALVGLMFSPLLFAHGVEAGDATFIEQASGAQLLPFIYLGAKHIFLYRMKDVGIYVTLFAVGHSVTLLYGVLSETNVNAYMVDAIIGFSVVYKALDNLGAFRRWFGFQPNTKAAVLIFGFFHGFGLATKLQDFTLAEDGLVANILAFNVGVEIGQLMALGIILIAMNFWRRTDVFPRQALAANVLLMSAGFMLMGYQLTGLYTVS